MFYLFRLNAKPKKGYSRLQEKSLPTRDKCMSWLCVKYMSYLQGISFVPGARSKHIDEKSDNEEPSVQL